MSKAKQKQLQKLRFQKQKKDHEYEVALRRLINQDQTLRISLDYCEKYLQNEVTQSLEQYSPIHINRMIFDKQLQKIEKQMSRMPDQSCRIQHFIIIMLKVLKLSFEKLPLYMIGLKDLFREIAQEGKDVVTFNEIFKYVIGEVIIMKEEQRNTEFHIQFSQKKKQDFLLHDNGIKKVYYSNDLKVVISLDYREQTIKVYDQDMRNVSRFAARKDMHHNRVPQIIDFDYSEISMRLGVIFADKTIQSIHLPHYINKTQAQFQSTSLNQLLFPLPKLMKKIYYIHMLNKWLTFSDEIDELYLFDMEKVRLKPQEVMEKVTIDTNQMPIHIILQIVPLSVICVVAGHQISFYSENFKQQKYPKYIHHQKIQSLKYCEEKSTFYLLGSYEKCLTLFTINRNKGSFKIWNIGINKVISDFEVFPFYDTVLICDEMHDLRLLHEPTLKTYKQQSYGHIVKVQNEPLRCYKTSKTDFMVYQTYMIGLQQEKVAIQRDIELNFANCYHYDHKKEEFYFSFNDQIVCFSLLFGDIRKSFNSDTSNLSKHDCFFLGKNTHPFLIDKHQTIYELYMKNAQIQGENKSYRRKLAVRDPFRYFYDEEMRNVMIVSGSSITQMRNDYHNNFYSINTINLVGFAKIVQARFCKTSKYLTLLTGDSILYQLQNFQRSISKCFKVQFLREKNDLEAIILDFNYCYQFQVMMVLNSNRQVFIFARHDTSNYISIDLTECLPYKLKGLNFNKLTYSIFKDKGKLKPSIILCDETGFILDLDLQSIFYRQFGNNKREELKIKLFVKEAYDIINDSSKVQTVQLGKSKKVTLKQSQLVLQRAHDKQVSIVTKVPLQLSVVLSISKDGYIKLWSESYQCLFSLKLPNLMKTHWNMKEIHTIKNNKSIREINEIIKLHYSHKKEIIEPVQALVKTRRFKHTVELPKTSKFLQELPLQIDSKEVEDIVTKQQNYYKIFLTSRVNRAKVKYNPEKTTIDSHPWRTRKEFVKIYEKASPTNKYAKSMPKNLINLRTSLDMTQRKKKKENYQAAELVLPMLKSYENQKAIRDDPQAKKPKRQQEEQFQVFESCIYVKTQRHRKKPNELDEIDREFMRKQIEMKKRRQSNLYRQENKSMTIDLSQSTALIAEQSRYDTIRDIRSVFEDHNRECLQGKRGRIIKVPEIKIKSEDQ